MTFQTSINLHMLKGFFEERWGFISFPENSITASGEVNTILFITLGHSMTNAGRNRGIHADVIVYIFAHLHTNLRTEENLLGIYWLQTAKKLVKRNT